MNNKEDKKKLQNYSYYLLNRRDYSVFELNLKFINYIKKHKLNISKDDIDDLIFNLQEDQFQSDNRLAFFIFKDAYLSYKGINYIKTKLSQKKIEFNLEKIISYDENFNYDFFESCKEYTLKKYSDLNIDFNIDFKLKSKIYNHLYNRGFLNDEINYALKSLVP